VETFRTSAFGAHARIGVVDRKALTFRRPHRAFLRTRVSPIRNVRGRHACRSMSDAAAQDGPASAHANVTSRRRRRVEAFVARAGRRPTCSLRSSRTVRTEPIGSARMDDVTTACTSRRERHDDVTTNASNACSRRSRRVTNITTSIASECTRIEMCRAATNDTRRCRFSGERPIRSGHAGPRPLRIRRPRTPRARSFVRAGAVSGARSRRRSITLGQARNGTCRYKLTARTVR